MIARRPVLERRVIGGVLVRPAEGEGSILLAGTGAAIWELTATTVDRETLRAEIGRRYDGDAAQLADDVDVVLGMLIEIGALSDRDG